MKKLFRKVLAIILMAALIAGVMPLTGLEGVFKFSPLIVKAAESDPFDTSSLTVLASNNYKGAKWTWYNNGLLWVQDDISGETQYGGNQYYRAFDIDDILDDSEFTATQGDIKYIYWDITAPNSCELAYCSGLLEAEAWK